MRSFGSVPLKHHPLFIFYMHSEKDTAELVAEQNSGQVLVFCKDHSYYPGKVTSLPQGLGCKHCIMAKLWYEFASVPPSKREERMEQLVQMTHHMVEDFERGAFDVNVFSRPQVSIESDTDEKKIILTDSEI